jgi:peptide/nickel transport system substrate-binding protein
MILREEIAVRTPLLIALVLSLLSSAMGIGDAQVKPPEGTLTVGYHSFAKEILDPGLGTTTGVMYDGHMFDYLIGAAPNGELTADRGLATDWRMSTDGSTWTIRLRPKVQWHDGRPFTADDVVFTLGQRYLAKDAVCTFCGSLKRAVQEVKALDPLTVEIRLKHPDITFFALLSSRDGDLRMLPKHGYRPKGDGFEQLQPPIGTGPWKFVERTIGDSITYAANLEYWDAQRLPTFARLRVLLRPEAATRLAMVRSGEADMATIDPGQARAAKAAGLRLLGPKSVQLPLLAFHVSFDPQFLTNRMEFRKTLALAIDMDAIMKRIYVGAEEFVTRANNTASWSPIALGYDPTLQPYPYDPQEARRLLKAVGYDGRPLKVWSFPAGIMSEAPEVLELVAGFWEAIGIKVELTPIEFAAFRPRYVSEPHKFEGGYAGHIAIDGPFPRPTMISNLVVAFASHRAGGILQEFHDLALLDAQLDKFAKILDLKDLDAALRELNRRMYAEYSTYPLVYRDLIFAAGPRVAGWSPANYGVAWYFETVKRAE